MTNTQPQIDVFLAHNSQDKKYVRNINQKLKRSRLKTWLDEEAILPGQIIQDEIQKVIPQIKSAAIFIGTQGLGRWQRVELRSFLTQCFEKDVIVIPVLLPGVIEIPRELVFLKEHKWVSFADGIEDKQALEELKSAIRQRRVKTKPTRLNKQQSTLNATSKASTTTAASQRKSNLPSTQESTKLRSSPTLKKQLSAGSSSTVRARKGVKSISSSGARVLLDDKLFLTKSVDTQADKSVILQISTADPIQEAALRNLHPEQHYSKKQIPYAYQNEAAMMQVESVLPNSIKGKTTFVLTLNPYQRGQGNSMMEMNINGYSADKIAELRARFILLNERPTASQNRNDYSILDSMIKGYDNFVKIEKCIFLDLWVKLKSKPQLFLTHARLAAVYYLKMSCIVEHILELKFSLIKSNTISVQFRGQRKQAFINQEPTVIEIKGNCLLNA